MRVLLRRSPSRASRCRLNPRDPLPRPHNPQSKRINPRTGTNAKKRDRIRRIRPQTTPTRFGNLLRGRGSNAVLALFLFSPCFFDFPGGVTPQNPGRHPRFSAPGPEGPGCLGFFLRQCQIALDKQHWTSSFCHGDKVRALRTNLVPAASFRQTTRARDHCRQRHRLKRKKNKRKKKKKQTDSIGSRRRDRPRAGPHAGSGRTFPTRPRNSQHHAKTGPSSPQLHLRSKLRFHLFPTR